MKSLKNNRNSGFSLVEMMVVFGLMGVAAVAFMKFQQNQMKATKTARNRVAFDEFMGNFKGYLKKPGICTKNLVDLTLRNEESLTGIKRPDGALKYEVGQKIPESTYKIEKIYLDNVYIDKEADGVQRYRGDAQIVVAVIKTDKNSYGGKQLAKRIEMDFLVDQNDKIIECAPLGDLSIPSGALYDDKSSAQESDKKPQSKTYGEQIAPNQEVKVIKSNGKEKLGANQYDKAFNNAVKDMSKHIGQDVKQSDINKAVKNNPQLQEAMKALKSVQEAQKKIDQILDEN